MRRLIVSLILLVLLFSPAFGQTLQEKRWKQATVADRNIRAIDGVIDRIMANKHRYADVEKGSGVPYYIIACLHNMEASGSFRLHLHEGSPLTGRTRWVPKGRPKTGNPPFQWEFSAKDALNYDKMGAVRWGSLDSMLYAVERYNGTGYLRYHPTVPTPYIWSYTSIYTRGKYVADGKWSSTAVSGQIGVGAILKRMEARGIIKMPR